MGTLLALFSTPARLQGLIIAAIAMLALILGLTTWALLERSGRLSAKVELVRAQDQAKVWEDAAGRCTASVKSLGEAGQGAIAETKRLLGLVEVGIKKQAALRDEARDIVKKPPPTRPDGKPRDCADALAEIRAKVKP